MSTTLEPLDGAAGHGSPNSRLERLLAEHDEPSGAGGSVQHDQRNRQEFSPTTAARALERDAERTRQQGPVAATLEAQRLASARGISEMVYGLRTSHRNQPDSLGMLGTRQPDTELAGPEQKGKGSVKRCASNTVSPGPSLACTLCYPSCSPVTRIPLTAPFLVCSAIDNPPGRAGGRSTRIGTNKKGDQDVETETSENMYLYAVQPAWFILVPDSLTTRVFDFVLVLSLMYCAYEVPFRACYGETFIPSEEFELVLDLFFVFDIVRNFFSAYPGDGGTTVVELPKIARRCVRRASLPRRMPSLARRLRCARVWNRVQRLSLSHTDTLALSAPACGRLGTSAAGSGLTSSPRFPPP